MSFCRKCKNALRHAVRHLLAGDVTGWVERLRAQVHLSKVMVRGVPRHRTTVQRHLVLSHPEHIGAAQAVSKHLRVHGWHVDLVSSYGGEDTYDWYFVIDPDSLGKLPPARKCILYIIEGGDKVLEKHPGWLKESGAVLAPSLEVIHVLAQKKIRFPLVHYLPLRLGGAQRVLDDGVEAGFLFDRFLIAYGLLPAAAAKSLAIPLPANADRIGLSLPETIERRRVFEGHVPTGYTLFDGLRRQPGWIGCGMSYQALARYALEQGLSRLSVMEDDAVLPVDFDKKMAVVEAFLDRHAGQWDLFSGVISELDDQTRILSVATYQGMTFAMISKMSGMVFNIYSRQALEILATWDCKNEDSRNTIDRYLARHEGLRVVVALPFLVGHRENAQSTLWGGSNRLYARQIVSCERDLQQKAANFRPIPD